MPTSTNESKGKEESADERETGSLLLPPLISLHSSPATPSSLLPPSLPSYVATGTYPSPCPFRRAGPTQGPFSLQWPSAARPRSPTDITGRNDVDAHTSACLGIWSWTTSVYQWGSCRADPAYQLPATRDLDPVCLSTLSIRFVVPFSAPTSAVS